MARDDPTIYMRIPQALKDQLDEASNNNRRSLTAEVVARLEASFAISEVQPTLDAIRQMDEREMWQREIKLQYALLSLENRVMNLQAQLASAGLVRAHMEARLRILATEGDSSARREAEAAYQRSSHEVAHLQAQQTALDHERAAITAELDRMKKQMASAEALRAGYDEALETIQRQTDAFEAGGGLHGTGDVLMSAEQSPKPRKRLPKKPGR